jgi:hypothetical protein
MTPAEIKAIGDHVKKTRMAKDLPPLPHAFPLAFRNGRILKSVDDLVGLERQAVAFLLDGVGQSGPPEAIFSEEAQDEGMCDVEVWDVHGTSDELAYRVWLFSDNGCVFQAATIDIVGGISQGGLSIRDSKVGEELIAARDRVTKKERPKNSVLDMFDLD